MRVDSQEPGMLLPLRTAFVHSFFPPADLRIWPCRASIQAKLVIVFIPGNPGYVDYYDIFHSAIHALMPEETDIYAIGHIGHSAEYTVPFRDALWPLSKRLGGKPCPSLEDQVRHKIAFIDHLAQDYPPETKMVLISHSVGSFISSKVLAARPHLVKHAYCLFPTISHIAVSPNGRKLAPLFKHPLIVSMALVHCLLLLLPAFVIQSLVAVVTRQRQTALGVTTSLVLSPSATAACLVMGRDEMKTIKDLDRSFLDRYGDRLTFYWAEGERDEWVPDSTVKEIIAALAERKAPDVNGDVVAKPGARGDAAEFLRRWYRCDEGMVHAFCLGAPLQTLDAKCRAHVYLQIIACRWRRNALDGFETTFSLDDDADRTCRRSTQRADGGSAPPGLSRCRVPRIIVGGARWQRRKEMCRVAKGR